MKKSMKIMGLACVVLVSQQAVPIGCTDKLSVIAKEIRDNGACAAHFVARNVNAGLKVVRNRFQQMPVPQATLLSLAIASTLVLLAIEKAGSEIAQEKAKRKREREERSRVECPYSAEEMGSLLPIELNYEGHTYKFPGAVFLKNQWCMVQSLAQGNAVGLYGPRATYFMSAYDFMEEVNKTSRLA